MEDYQLSTSRFRCIDLKLDELVTYWEHLEVIEIYWSEGIVSLFILSKLQFSSGSRQDKDHHLQAFQSNLRIKSANMYYRSRI
jgi:hypothetical protein